jgi:hypothetical protein
MNHTNSSTRSFSGTICGIMVPLALLCSLAACSQIRAGQEPGKLDPDGVLAHLRQAARDFDSLYKNVRIEGTHVATRPNRTPAKDQNNSPARTIHSGFTYAQSEGREKLLLSPPDPTGSGTAVVRSGDRRFRLMRKGTHGTWYVETDLSSDDDWPALMRYRSWLIESPYNPGCIPRFREYLDSPDFKIREVSRSTEGGVELTKAVFEYAPQDTKKPRLAGWLRVDPARNWAIHDYDFDVRLVLVREGTKSQTSIRNKGFVNYSEQDGRLIPAEIEVSKHAQNGNIVTDHTNIAQFLFATSPPEEFTLSAFGLGDYELTVGQAQARTTYRTIALAVGAFLAAFVLFRTGRSIQKSTRASNSELIRRESLH